MQLDLCSMQSVRKFAKQVAPPSFRGAGAPAAVFFSLLTDVLRCQVRDTHPRVDVLFNNAGILRWRGWVLTRDGFGARPPARDPRDNRPPGAAAGGR